MDKLVPQRGALKRRRTVGLSVGTVIRCGKWNEHGAGGSVISIATDAPMGVGHAVHVRVPDCLLLSAGTVRLPTDGKDNLFAGARGAAQ